LTRLQLLKDVSLRKEGGKKKKKERKRDEREREKKSKRKRTKKLGKK
jgi:hypothetical protein